jgi:DNA-binding LacI/PurR family transcriptional regulator
VTSSRQTDVLAQLRRRIVTGDYQPGQRLPTRRELEDQFHVSRVTVQAALDRLAEDGFVLADGRRGTFVHQYPPHRCRYALVLPTAPNAFGWSHYLTALLNEAQRYRDDAHRQIFPFHRESTDPRRSLAQLDADILADRLAGIIFAPTWDSFPNSPMHQRPALPRVAINCGPAQHVVTPHTASLAQLAVPHLVARGRRRFAVLAYQSDATHVAAEFAPLLNAHGLAFERRWFQATGTGSAAHCLELMFHPSQGDRPDGLFILDDNLVPEATAGLAALKLKIPAELEVLAHTNFPWPTASAVPVTRLGFDVRRILETAIQIIDRRRRGEPVAPVTAVPATWDPTA